MIALLDIYTHRCYLLEDLWISHVGVVFFFFFFFQSVLLNMDFDAAYVHTHKVYPKRRVVLIILSPDNQSVALLT